MPILLIFFLFKRALPLDSSITKTTVDVAQNRLTVLESAICQIVQPIDNVQLLKLHFLDHALVPLIQFNLLQSSALQDVLICFFNQLV